MSKLKKAIFPVDGLGTRFLPATKAMPKEMLPVVDKPIIQYVFEEAIEAGFEEFIFIIGRNKSVIANHFDNSYELQKILTEAEKKSELELTTKWMPKPGSIAFVRQQEPLGLGHAVWCARNFVSRDEHFAVLLPDELMQQNCLKQMRKVYDKSGGNIIAVSEVAKHETNKYGIVGLEKGSSKISQMVEKPKPENAPSNLAIIGRYILSGEIFEVLDKGEKGAGGEIQLTDAMAKMLGKQSFNAHKYEGNRFDCGSKAGFLEANIAYALERKDLKPQVAEMLKKYART